MKNLLRSLVVILFVTSSLYLQGQESHNFEISKNLDIYSSLLKELDKNYAEEINPADLNEAGIEAMLETLDPYTVYIPESRSEDYRMMTTGQYGGIGSLIHKQGDYVVISEPYEGFPAQKAGLKPGDKILEINDKSMIGKESSEVSEILKGQPGVELDITIERYGETEPVGVKIKRENIKIPNLPFYGMLEDGIGYIKLTNFARNAGTEVKKAFNDLKANNELNGLIIDLRNNGGGLLNEAVNLTNIFVDKGELIVSTKGKLATKNYDHKTRMAPMDTDIPLVVLVNRSSASASEIVAGAIQDLDRGVIIGQKTFGKGLVQNVVPLPYNSQVKITVAKYYIPSGRCIQSIDYFNKDENGYSGRVPDSLINEFETKNGRLVYDGGGIEPDIAIEPDDASKITKALITDYMIFDYANEFARKHDTIAPAEEFQITEQIYADFLVFVEQHNLDYHTDSEDALDQLKKSAEKENYFDAIEEVYMQLKEQMMEDKQADLLTHREEISRILKEEIASRYYYQTGRIKASLDDDKEINKALEILKGGTSYLAILEGKDK
jgi:carboxyl-terminal processing protease